MAVRKLPLLVALLLIAMPVVAVYGNYYSGFDLNTAGTVNPPPWTLMYRNSTGYFTNETGGPGAFTGGVLASHSLSPPNDYLISYTGSSSAANYEALVGVFNASANSVVVNVYAKSQDVVAGAEFFYFILVNPGNDTQWNASNATFEDSSLSYGNYTLISVSIPVVPNQQVTIIFGVEKDSSLPVDVSSHAFYFDDFAVQGADSVVSGYNLVMMDFETGYLFNIAAYTNSRIYVNYSNGLPPFVLQGPTSPTVILPNYAEASLITVWVSDSYYRTLIPQPGVTEMYLNMPNATEPYIFNIVDLTQRYPPSSKIFVSYSGRVMTSGYTDAASTFSTYLEPGTYSVLIVHGANSYSQPIVLGSASSSVTLAILKVTYTGPGGIQTSASYGTTWSGDYLVADFNDVTNTTSELTFTLLMRTGAGTLTVYTETFDPEIPYGNWELSTLSNSTYAPTLLVELQIVNIYGTWTEGPFAVDIPRGSLFATTPNFPMAILGLGAVIPNANAYPELMAAVVIIVLAAGFGARFAPFGFLVISLAAFLFGMAGWLPLDETLFSILIPIAVVGIMAAKQRGSGN